MGKCMEVSSLILGCPYDAIYPIHVCQPVQTALNLQGVMNLTYNKKKFKIF